MENTTVQMSIAEKTVVGLCAFVWRALKLLDPQPIQRYFAGRVNVQGVNITGIHDSAPDDAINNICRINNNRMKQGKGFLGSRGDLIKIFNPANGKFVCRYAQGAGDLKIRYNQIGLDYNAKIELGILDAEEVDLQVMKANPADREFYLMYQDSSVSSRHSRALGWYLLIGSLMAGLLTQVYGWVAILITAFF